MKREKINIFRLLMVVLFVGFCLIGCENPAGSINNTGDVNNDDKGTKPDDIGDDDDTTVGEIVGPISFDAFFTTLESLRVNTASTPHVIILDSSTIINTSDSSSTGVWATINSTVKNFEKYVILDISECTVTNNTLTGAYSPSGCNMNIIRNNQYIKGLVLPDSLKNIGRYAF